MLLTSQHRFSLPLIDTDDIVTYQVSSKVSLLCPPGKHVASLVAVVKRSLAKAPFAASLLRSASIPIPDVLLAMLQEVCFHILSRSTLIPESRMCRLVLLYEPLQVVS